MNKKISIDNGKYLMRISKSKPESESLVIECYKDGEFQWEDCYSDKSLHALFYECLQLREARK